MPIRRLPPPWMLGGGIKFNHPDQARRIASEKVKITNRYGFASDIALLTTQYVLR